MKYAALNAGPLGGEKCLVMVTVSNNLDEVVPAEKWAKALDICLAEAKELKYEDGITHYGNTSFHLTRIVCLRSSSAFCSFSISHSFCCE